MPRKSDKLVIGDEKLDRRVKLTTDDKVEIKRLHAEGKSIRGIARQYGVDKKAISYVLFPERIPQWRANRDWRKYYDKEKWRETMKEHRAYKKQLLLEGKIGEKK
jgi:IS30 family transposase